MRHRDRVALGTEIDLPGVVAFVTHTRLGQREPPIQDACRWLTTAVQSYGRDPCRANAARLDAAVQALKDAQRSAALARWRDPGSRRSGG